MNVRIETVAKVSFEELGADARNWLYRRYGNLVVYVVDNVFPEHRPVTPLEQDLWDTEYDSDWFHERGITSIRIEVE